MPTENLCEVLFKPSPTAKETSTIIKVEGAPNYPCHESSDHNEGRGFYRVLKRPLWAWEGVDLVEMEAIFSTMSASQNERSDDRLIDTVKGYHSGNWNYEWVQLGMKYQKAAMQAAQQADMSKDHVADLWLKASTHYNIAAYPHLSGDELAMQADVLAMQAYREALQLKHHTIKTIEFNYKGKAIQAYLHLPRTDKALPTVIVSGGLDTPHTELWRTYTDYFAPAGIAMVTLDMPSLGHSHNCPLHEDTSVLHMALLDELQSVPWVDQSNIVSFGTRVGANAAIRLSILAAGRIKAGVSLGGTLHDFFSGGTRLDTLPRMYYDVFASRLGKKVTTKTSLLGQLTAFSLKQQGLLGRRPTRVPLLGVSLEGDCFCPPSDNQLLAASSLYGKSVILPDSPLNTGYHRCMTTVISWLKQQIC
ncbi:esterase FrsA [Thaumasiovibrio sp. DFM-14]|uniref:esterase FrsA n=1 Tax=Thaumasiovibrio sp. DFM-14 TaxID=3384792 RepID=UPI0039A3B7DA